jgi:hypothetical protein
MMNEIIINKNNFLSKFDWLSVTCILDTGSFTFVTRVSILVLSQGCTSTTVTVPMTLNGLRFEGAMGLSF